MIFLAKTSKDGGIEFSSDYTKAHFEQWLKDNPGKPIRIDTDQKVSEDLRGYYFGAVIPVLRRTCDQWKNLKPIEIHQIIKKMFFAFESYNPITKRTERFARSIMADSDWNNTKKAMQFLEIVRQYVVDCGEEWPDNEEYNRWKNSSPLKGEKFIPRQS